MYLCQLYISEYHYNACDQQNFINVIPEFPMWTQHVVWFEISPKIHVYVKLQFLLQKFLISLYSFINQLHMLNNLSSVNTSVWNITSDKYITLLFMLLGLY